jgi:hypothetical protein
MYETFFTSSVHSEVWKYGKDRLSSYSKVLHEMYAIRVWFENKIAMAGRIPTYGSYHR